MPRRPLALSLAACVLLAAGCGGDDPRAGIDPNDKRANALVCLNEEQEVAAKEAGPDGIQVDGGADGPRIRFYTNSGEAEAAQFEGRGEGAEHIGSALLFTRGGSEDMLEKVEECLSDL